MGTIWATGQAQQGIDLFARIASGKYEVWQAKRYASISARDVKAIVMPTAIL
jgi:hypothetical protein